MAVQTTYSAEHSAAFPGMLQSRCAVYNAVSRVNAGTATIPYGKGVVTSGEGGMDTPVDASTAAEFIGVLMYELNRAQAEGEVAGCPVDRDGTVVTMGPVAVTVLDTVTKDSPVYLRVGSTGRGDFSGIVGTGVTLGVLIPNAKFLTGGDAGDTVFISLTIGG